MLEKKKLSDDFLKALEIEKNLIDEIKISLETYENKIENISQKTSPERRNRKDVKIRAPFFEVPPNE